ncbi:MAG: hypothetical protein NC924_03815, partial [Candidatus Omnitrophica bacterium]|nr:hypothetical protein [Candidatus Omnitrophota bacterium]
MSGVFDRQDSFFKSLFKTGAGRILLACLIFGLYVLVVVTFRAVPIRESAPPDQKKYTNLYLQQFLAGYRSYQQDFDVEDIYFGEKFLSFRLNLKLKPKADYLVRKLAGDIITNLNGEYPELELIRIEFSRREEGL